MYGQQNIHRVQYRQVNELLQERKTMLESLIRQKELSLMNGPEGSLRVSRHTKNEYQYYLRMGKEAPNGMYIPKKKMELIRALAQKGYDQKILRLAQNELKGINSLLHTYEGGCIDAVYEAMPEPRRLLVAPFEPTDDQYVEEWLAEEYEHMGFAEGSPEYYTGKGERVRSKSEIIIADTLFRMGIPYKYERPLNLPGYLQWHPDFTVLNVRQRKEYLWEHLGMMDDAEYAEKALEKINTYISLGFYPGDNLILTHETAAHPFNTRIIESLAAHYLQ